MRKIYYLILLLLLAGCGGGNLDRDFTDGSVSFESVNKLPIVLGTLNGKKAYYILDSGASISVLDDSQKGSYGFGSIKSGDYSAVGYGGVAQFYDAYRAVGEIGGVVLDVRFKSQNLFHLTSVIRSSTGYGIVGIIGSDFFRKHGGVIDYGRNELRKTVSAP